MCALNPVDDEPGRAEDDSRSNQDRPRVIDSSELLQGAKEVWILHEEELYRLRLTSRGKLHLTK